MTILHQLVASAIKTASPSLESLAARLRLSTSALRRYRLGDREPSADTVRALAGEMRKQAARLERVAQRLERTTNDGTERGRNSKIAGRRLLRNVAFTRGGEGCRRKRSAGRSPLARRGSSVTVYEREPAGLLYARAFDRGMASGRGGYRRVSLSHRDRERAKTYAMEHKLQSSGRDTPSCSRREGNTFPSARAVPHAPFTAQEGKGPT